MTPPLTAPIALPRWQRYSIYVVVFVLVASGVGWLMTGWRMDAEMSGPVRIAAAWCLRIHGTAAYVLLVIAGSVLPVHVRPSWRRRRNRWSGASLSALLLLLAATGLWLYYGTEAGRDAISTAHWAMGLALPVWLLLHRHWGLGWRRR